MYTAASPILGAGVAGAQQIASWYAANNPALYASFCGVLAGSICNQAAAVGLNADLLAGQIAHETGYWSSRYALERNNPGGLGAVNDDPDRALAFPSPDAGIRAMVAHLLTYCLGTQNPLRGDDPRYDAWAAAGSPRAVVLSDLDGRWAWPGVGYGAAIARLANELVAARIGRSGENPAMGDDQGNVEYLQSSNYTAGRDGHTVERIVLHTTEGTYEGALTWLRGAAAGSENGNSSTHYLVRADGSEQRQLVREADTAWTVGNGDWNLRTVSIEQEGYAAVGGFSDGLYAAVGALVGRIAARWGVPLDREHVIGHKDVPSQDHTDPGPHYDFDRVLAIASAGAPAAVVDSVGRQSQPEAVRRDPVTGCALIGGFRAYVEWLESELGADEALMLLGRPITAERVEDGLTVQWFERARLERHPGARPERWDVLLARLGAAAVR